MTLFVLSHTLLGPPVSIPYLFLSRIVQARQSITSLVEGWIDGWIDGGREGGRVDRCMWG